MKKKEDQPELPVLVTNIARTYTNLLVIGDVQDVGDDIIFYHPCNVFPDEKTIHLFEFDKQIIGKELEFLKLRKSDLIYCVPPGEELNNLYQEILSDKEENKDKDKDNE